MNTRGLRPGDDRAVEGLFTATVALGRPLPFACPRFEDYVDLCLGWYLGPGRDDVVLLEELDRIVGYALVCVDGRSHREWVRRVAAGWTVHTVRGILAGRYPREAERFYRLRLRDGWDGLIGPPPPCPAHLHLNVAETQRGASAGRLLIDAAEQRLRDGGQKQWYGEINVPVGRRAGALERLGARVLLRQPNRTLSWVADRPIERLRVTRAVPDPPYSQPLRRKARYSSPDTVTIATSTVGYPKRHRNSGKVSKFIP